MKSITADNFKDLCLKTLDEVASTKTPIVITRHGRPIAKLHPYAPPSSSTSLAGSVVREKGDPYGTCEWVGH